MNVIISKKNDVVENVLSMPRGKERKMTLLCRACDKRFDSTFGVEDFASLSSEQMKSGTIHLCPFCGELAIYQLVDYQEPSD